MSDISRFAAELLLTLQLSLGQTPIDPPRTLAIDIDTLKGRICADPVSRNCRVKAWYSPEGTIYVDENLDIVHDIFSESILVHELYHHIQRMKTGRTAANCQEWREREYEAYEAQRAWLLKHGASAGPLRATRFPFVLCN